MRAVSLFALKAVIGGALLWFITTRVPFHDALSVAASLDPAIVVVAIALYLLAHAVNAAKLVVFLPGLSLWQSWRFTMIGVLYGTVLPGQLAGDAVKAVRLARVQGSGDEAAAVAAVAVDKIVGLFALFLVMAFAIAVDAGVFGRAIVVSVALATGAAITGLAAVIVLPVPAWFGRFGASIAAWRTASMRPAPLSLALVLGLVFQALCVGICMVLGENLNIGLSVAAWALVMGFSSLVLLAPVSIAGIGVREASLVTVIGALGGSEVGAFALSLVLLAVNLVGAGVGFAVDLVGRDRSS
jgi:glycosyltransferase 2 family protein